MNAMCQRTEKKRKELYGRNIQIQFIYGYIFYNGKNLLVQNALRHTYAAATASSTSWHEN